METRLDTMPIPHSSWYSIRRKGGERFVVGAFTGFCGRYLWGKLVVCLQKMQALFSVAAMLGGRVRHPMKGWEVVYREIFVGSWAYKKRLEGLLFLWSPMGVHLGKAFSNTL